MSWEKEFEKIMPVDWSDRGVSRLEIIAFIHQTLKAQMSDLRKEVELLRKNERNMAKGNIQLETVAEVYAWNYALDEVLLLMKAGEDK